MDESNLDGGPLTVTDTIPHDFGEDGPGDIQPNGDFVALFQVNGQAVTLTSAGVPIVVTQTANGYTGTAGGQTIFTLTVDPNTGQYTYQQFDAIDHPDASNPDDVIWLKFGVTITDYDGDTDTAHIGIDVHDDGPSAQNDALTTEEGQTVSGNVLTNDDVGADQPGSVMQVTIGGTTYTVPAGGSATIPASFGTLVINSNGSYSYTAGGNGQDGTDVFTYMMKDADGDTDTASLSITVDADDQPVVVNAVETVDESFLNIVETGTVSVNYGGDGPGTVAGNGTFSASGSLSGGVLSHDSTPVSVTLSGNTYTGTAGGVTVFTLQVNANGTYEYRQFQNLDHADGNNPNDIITLNFGVTATDSDGDTGNGFISINVRDDAPVANNDTVSSWNNLITGNVLNNDDVGNDDPGEVIEFTATLWGNTQTYTVVPGGTFIDTHAGRLTLFQDGSYELLTDNDSWRGNETVTVMYTMRDNDGDTSSAQLTITHRDAPPPPPPQNGDGGCPLVLDLDGDGIEMTTRSEGVLFDIWDNGELNQTAWVRPDDALLAIDGNGDGIIDSHSELIGDITTDGFSELATYNSNGDGVIDANDSIWGELLAWRDLNQDGVSQDGELFTMDQVGISSISLNTIQTDYYNNGSWVPVEGSFTFEDGREGLTADVWFDFELNGEEPIHTVKTDEELGAVDLSLLTIGDTPDGTGPVVHGSIERIYESLLTKGTQVIRDKVNVFHEDDDTLGGVRFNGNFDVIEDSINQGMLSHNNRPVAVSLNGDTYIGTVGNLTIFTMQVLANGVYNFELYETLDHFDPTNAHESLVLEFGIDVYDSDGDKVESSIRIRVKDDASDANDDNVSIDLAQDSFVTGNVLDNDDLGIESMMEISSVRFEGVEHNVVTGEALVIDGAHGTLTIHNDGTYSYLSDIDGTSGSDVFAYTFIDQDGDTSTANLSMNIAAIDDSSVLFGTDDADLFLFQTIEEGATTVHGFDTAQGDAIDLSALLEGQADVDTAIGDFVHARSDGNGNTILSVDQMAQMDQNNIRTSSHSTTQLILTSNTWSTMAICWFRA